MVADGEFVDETVLIEERDEQRTLRRATAAIDPDGEFDPAAARFEHGDFALTETEANSGIFTGEIPTVLDSAAPPTPDGKLSVASADDTVHAVYADAAPLWEARASTAVETSRRASIRTSVASAAPGTVVRVRVEDEDLAEGLGRDGHRGLATEGVLRKDAGAEALLDACEDVGLVHRGLPLTATRRLFRRRFFP